MADFNILVTGASGYIGKHIVNRFIEKKQVVKASYHHRIPVNSVCVESVCTDLNTLPILRNRLKGVDVVIHLAQNTEFHKKHSKAELEKVAISNSENVRMTKNLLIAMQENGVSKIIYLSALGVSKNVTSSWFLREKYEIEKMIINSNLKQKIILRSAPVWKSKSINDRFFGEIIEKLKWPLYTVPKSNYILAPVHIDNISSIILDKTNEQNSVKLQLNDVYGRDLYSCESLLNKAAEIKDGKKRLALKGALAKPFYPFFSELNSLNSFDLKIPCKENGVNSNYLENLCEKINDLEYRNL